MAGVAWAPTRGIARVEVRLDDRDWEECELTAPLADAAWVQWRFAADLPAGGEYRLQVRATDGMGDTQTAAVTDPAPDGATGHHTITFRTE